MIDDATREYFDRQLDWVVERLPPQVRQLLDEVPLYIEDYPSKKIRESFGLRHRDELQGLYSGVALPDRTVEMPPILSEVVYLFREGILALAVSDEECWDETELREQIRVTLLHELGHHFGLDEQELDDLGYG